METHRVEFYYALPPYLIEAIAESENVDPATRERARHALELAQERYKKYQNLVRGGPRQPISRGKTGDCSVFVYELEQESTFRFKQSPIATREFPTDERDWLPSDYAYFTGLGMLHFYKEVLGIDSFDGHCHDIGITLGCPHMGTGASFDPDIEEVLVPLPISGEFLTEAFPDILAHEIDHGQTLYSTRLGQEGVSGTINEHKSDVTAVTFIQWLKKQKATADSHWTLGAEAMIDYRDREGNLVVYYPDGRWKNEKLEVNPPLMDYAVRTFKAEPAYKDHPLIIKTLVATDPQPKHMSGFVPTTSGLALHDQGGIHLNSGILNHAYYLAATSIGGFAWQGIYRVWIQAFVEAPEGCDFKTFAKLTLKAAQDFVGDESIMWSEDGIKKVADAWVTVGVLSTDEVEEILTPKIQPAAQPPQPSQENTGARLHVVPSYLLDAISKSEMLDESDQAQAQLDYEDMLSRHEKMEQVLRGDSRGQLPATDTGECRQRVYTTDFQTPLKLRQNEARPAKGSDRPSGDKVVNTVYDHMADILRFYETVLDMRSIDNRCHNLNVTVHYLKKYDGAFWDSGLEEIFIGDGDGKIFKNYDELDILAHEAAHGHTTYFTKLQYQGQTGAIIEHKADVTAVTVMQWKNQVVATPDAPWTIGAATMIDWLDTQRQPVKRRSDGHIIGVDEKENPPLLDFAMRTFKDEPAYLGHPWLDVGANKDPQPKHMNGYQRQLSGTSSEESAHLNCGILNHAYYLAATAIRGNAWETTYQIWNKAFLMAPTDCDFATFAGLTIEAARQLSLEKDSKIKASDANLVAQAWVDVGVLTTREMTKLLAQSP